MIVPSKTLRKFIKEMFESQNEFAKNYDVDPATLTRYLQEEITCSSGFMEMVKSKSGMTFETAFEVKE